MDRPAVRYLDVQPFGDRFLISDPLGVSEPLLITPELLLIMSLMDGSRDKKDIKVEFFRRTGMLLSSEDLEEVMKLLDEHHLLLNGRFFKKLEELKSLMLKRGIKEPFHTGEAYPKEGA